MIFPVILCGGSGTRLWPLSRKSYPKQFARLTGRESLFQASVRRLSGEGFAPPLILTNADFRFIVAEQLAEIGVEPTAILIEPEGRNTAPAVLAAALWLRLTAPDAMMLVAPSDHVVPDAGAFRAAVLAGMAACEQGDLVTFGIRPDRAETGYGYLELADKDSDYASAPRKLKRFVEKPDAANAERMLTAGCYLWNAGIFLFSVQCIVEGFTKHAADMLEPCQQAVAEARADLGFLRLAAEPWARLRDVSIDYAVMEHAHNLSVVPFDGGWSDLGGWDAVWRESTGDQAGVVISGEATSIDCRNSLLRSENANLEIVGIGLENIVAIAMPDAVLVADISRAQDVKLAVAALKTKGVKQAEQFPRDHRPWGWFETLSLGGRFQVKRIMVHPGAALSLQSHVHRSEHWIVVAGTAQVTVGETVSLVTENQSVYIPVGSKHRLENPGKVDLHLIEVQTGSYLGEDDITRYEDVYSRD
ncbi:MAG: mannose-1-phosphate guanylyltransferase/mannose-6-phosphate isomerase [Rhodobacteraceae bacterium]|nr:mannose-1-phosphate guanylyltransferase/mannose-6-phosphate isomerase [Paracoccaceae bacterium]